MARARVALAASLALVAGLLAAAPASAAPALAPAPRGASTPDPSPARELPDPVVGTRAAQSPVTIAVRFRHGAARTSVGRLVAASTGRATRTIPALDVVSYTVPASDLGALLASLRARPDVVSAQPAAVRRLSDVPNDTEWSHQAPSMTTTHVTAAWDVTHGSAGVKVAIVDSGVRTTHEDLDGAVPGSKVVGTYNAVDGGTNVADSIGHGTFVAGVAAARTGNALGVAGVGRDTSLLAVKVADASGTILSDVVAAGIVWAADHGARIINLSLGSEVADPTEQQAVQYAQSAGVLVVAAAGNDGLGANAVSYPAGYAGVVAVGATDAATGHRAPFSEHGGWVTLAAPGAGLWSTTASGGYAAGSGTSFASPFVAGAAALLAAYHPSATASQLRAALVASAHGVVGEGLGAGQVDVAGALARFAPPSVPTLTSPSGTVSGDTSLTATSSAAKVRFAVDGAALPLVAVSGGQAARPWSTWGLAGSHVVTAADCNAAGVCSAQTDSATVTVSNAAPVLTSPAGGDPLSGGYVVSATAPGGGVRFLVDGASVAFDATAPYSVTVLSSLADGSHSIVARQCDLTGVVCSGAVSAPVAFTSRSLHPVVTSVSPSPFSPNRDGRKDTATVVYSLPDSEAVVARVYDSQGTRMLGPLSWGTLGRGSHSFVVRGTTTTGVRWPDGVYTVVLSTTATVDGVELRGAASRAFRLDSTPTALSAVTGSGTGFFPYPDGYRDAFAPLVTIDEGATLSLVVRTTRAAPVRTVSITRTTAGRYVVAWNGRDARGALVPAGWYYWRLQAVDRGGNVRVTRWYTVKVSLARLQTRAATLRVAGSRTREFPGSPACAGTSVPDSTFASGRWIVNNCPAATTGAASAAAYVSIALPAATAYTSIFVRAYGYTSSAPTWVEGRVRNVVTGRYDRTGVRELDVENRALWSLGGITGTGHVAGRVATVAVSVPNTYDPTPPFDFDLAYVDVVVYYRVLA